MLLSEIFATLGAVSLLKECRGGDRGGVHVAFKAVATSRSAIKYMRERPQ